MLFSDNIYAYNRNYTILLKLTYYFWLINIGLRRHYCIRKKNT